MTPIGAGFKAVENLIQVIACILLAIIVNVLLTALIISLYSLGFPESDALEDRGTFLFFLLCGIESLVFAIAATSAALRE